MNSFSSSFHSNWMFFCLFFFFSSSPTSFLLSFLSIVAVLFFLFLLSFSFFYFLSISFFFLSFFFSFFLLFFFSFLFSFSFLFLFLFFSFFKDHQFCRCLPKEHHFWNAAGAGDLSVVQTLTADPTLDVNWHSPSDFTSFNAACFEGRVSGGVLAQASKN